MSKEEWRTWNCNWLDMPLLKGRLFTRGLTQTAVLRKQWASGILYKTVDVIKYKSLHNSL